MALVDRGDSRAVTYLGSCMLTTTATGVGAIQKPLKDLYFSYRQSGGAPDPTRQRYLTMSSRGLTMSWREASKPAPTEVFYKMPNILFWDAVQFVVVKGAKKLCGAFEPLDNDHSRNKDNLFVVLDKKFHFLQQMSHPSLFVCVLRRTTGVKAMDVHVFVCSSDDEALGLVHGLNTIQDSYNENQVNETGAFSYRPFYGGGEVGGGGPPPVTRPVSGLGHPPTGPGSGNLQHLAAQNAVAAAAAARDSQAYPRQPPGQIGHKSHEPNSSQPNSAISLTQNDFQPISRGSPEREPLRARRPAFPEPDVSRIEEEEEDWHNDENIYQYIRHISDSDYPAVAPSRGGVDSRGFSPPNSGGPPPVTSPYDRNRNRIPSGDNTRDGFGRSPPKEYQSMTRSIDLDQDTISATARKPSNIIARFEERSKVTAAVRPQSIVQPKVAPKTAPKPVPSPVDRNPGKLGQGYSFLSGSGSPLSGQEDRRYDYDNAPSPYPRARSPGYDRELPADSSLPRPHLIPSAFYSNQDHHRNTRAYDEYTREPPRIPDRSIPIAADAWHPPRNEYNPPPPRYQNQQRPEEPLVRQHQPSPFDRPRSFGERNTPDPPPPRPVAKVTPHKVSGVGVRVLPPNPAVLPRSPGGRPTGRVSPLDYHSQSDMPEEYHGGQQPPRGAKSQYYDKQKQQTDNYGSQERRDYEANWKHKPTENANLKKDNKKGEETDKNMSEKLLLSKKKDAEIASVMQNLRFDYDTSTVTPGVPAGNNFEKSLGYFP